MNVAVLRLNLRLDQAGRDRARLHAENARLASELSSASAAAKIEQLARSRFGLVPAEEAQTTYLHLPPSAKRRLA